MLALFTAVVCVLRRKIILMFWTWTYTIQIHVLQCHLSLAALSWHQWHQFQFLSVVTLSQHLDPLSRAQQKAYLSFGFGLVVLVQTMYRSNIQLITMILMLPYGWYNCNGNNFLALLLYFLVHCVFLKEVLKHVSFHWCTQHLQF